MGVRIKGTDDRWYDLGYVNPIETVADGAGFSYVVQHTKNEDRVEAGQQIGVVQDITGFYRGITNHVHFQVSKARDPRTVSGRQIPRVDYYDPTPLVRSQARR